MRVADRLRALSAQCGESSDSGGSDAQQVLARLKRRSSRQQQRAQRVLIQSFGPQVAPGVLQREVTWTVKRSVPAARFFDTRAEQLVFMDTETTGLSSGAGSKAFLVGAARLDGAQWRCRQWLLTRHDGEAAMLQALAQWLPQAPVWVSYNGKSFDLPLLKTRWRMQRLPAIDGVAHIDLLHWTRRAFGRVWADCRLGQVERQLLAVHRGTDELPSAAVPQAWRAFVQRGKTTNLLRAVRHHETDIRSLIELLAVLPRVYQDPLTYRADSLGIARHWLAKQQPERAERCLDAERSAHQLLLGKLWYRNRRTREMARIIWQRCADRGEPEALLRLSMDAEHRQRQPQRALVWAQRLAALNSRYDRAALDHRLARLQRKCR